MYVDSGPMGDGQAVNADFAVTNMNAQAVAEYTRIGSFLDVMLAENERTNALNAQLDSIRVAAVYGLTFHPRFTENGYCYICYVVDPKKGGELLPMGTRVSADCARARRMTECLARS